MKKLLVIFGLLGFGCHASKQMASTIVEVEIVEVLDQDTVVKDTAQKKFAIVDSLEKIVNTYPPVLVEFTEGTIEEVFAKAKKEKKNLFVDFTASWCAPCLQMDRETFSEKEVGERLNTGFVNVRMDDENFDAYTLKERYKVSQLPTYLILSPNGKELYRIVGFKFWPRFLDEIKPY